MATREFVVYDGRKYWVQSTGAYFQSGGKADAERLLHRRVWADAHGPIPKGFEVHHKDHDWRNNALWNLELAESGAHQREHMLRRNADPVHLADTHAALALARVAAAEWHGSEAGLAWHREHGKRTWEGRASVPMVCGECGSEFRTFFATRGGDKATKYCSKRCGERARRFGRRYITDARACAFCGKGFMANRHRKTACCSRVCSNRRRAADARLQPDVTRA